MSPTLLAAVTDCAMDDAFWASRPGLEKRAADAGAAPQFDDGTIDIGGVKIPRKVLYGLAMGGLTGGAGGVAGGMDLKTIALLAALGASVGGASGYGLEKLDEHTPVEPGGTTSRADARRLEAEAKSRAAADAQQSGGVATQAIRAIKGDPSNDLLETGGTLAQAATGGLLGSKLQREHRARALNKLLARPGAGVDPSYTSNIDKLLGLGDKPGLFSKKPATPSKNDYAPLRRNVDAVTAVRARSPGGAFGANNFGAAPLAGHFKNPKMSRGVSREVQDALERNFQAVPRSFGGLRRNAGGIFGGALAMLSPSLMAFTGAPGDNNGALPLASLINHWRQPK